MRRPSPIERLEQAEAARRARVVELCELAKEIIRVSRQAPMPEHALAEAVQERRRRARRAASAESFWVRFWRWVAGRP